MLCTKIEIRILINFMIHTLITQDRTKLRNYSNCIFRKFVCTLFTLLEKKTINMMIEQYIIDATISKMSNIFN